MLGRDHICILIAVAGALSVGAAISAQDQLGTTQDFRFYQANANEDIPQNWRKAKENWVLNCQGCHKPDGGGLPEQGMPTLVNEVGKFLSVPGGREYLSQVPGVTNNSLSDGELSQLLNWILIEFDPDNIPDGFLPYSPQEVALLRQKALGADAPNIRKQLLNMIENKNSSIE